MIKKCFDCGGNLEEGAILDFTYGGVAVQRHAKATVPTTNQFVWGNGEAAFQDIRRVLTYRCTDCNRLFSYAQDIVLGKTLWDSQKRGTAVGIFVGLAVTAAIFIFALLAAGLF